MPEGSKRKKAQLKLDTRIDSLSNKCDHVLKTLETYNTHLDLTRRLFPSLSSGSFLPSLPTLQAAVKPYLQWIIQLHENTEESGQGEQKNPLLWKQEFWNTEAAKHHELSLDFFVCKSGRGRMGWGLYCLKMCFVFNTPTAPAPVSPSSITSIKAWLPKWRYVVMFYYCRRYLSASQNATVILICIESNKNVKIKKNNNNVEYLQERLC